MKKIIIVLFSLLLTVGCYLDKTPSKAVTELFKKYQALDDAVLNDLEFTTEGLDLKTENQKENYTKAMKMQYSDIKYEILDEDINGDEATVKVKISVYDFYKVQKEADEYKSSHKDEFIVDNNYDEEKFLNYKLNKLMEVSERIEYTIDIDLTKEDDEWVVEPFDKTTLEKIHGTYNYD